VDVVRASDHVRIASIPTISTPFGVAITRDGKRLYVSSYDSKTISTFDTETNALISTLTFGSELREIALTPDERFLYVPDYYEDVVHVVSTRENALVDDIPVEVNPHMVAFGARGRFAYVTNEFGLDVSVIDTQTRKVVTTIPVGQTPIGIVASPDSETIYVAAFSAAAIAAISVKSQSVIGTIPLPSSPMRWLFLLMDNAFMLPEIFLPVDTLSPSPTIRSWEPFPSGRSRATLSSRPTATRCMRRTSTPRTITRSTRTHCN
jgi:YVTN family beta-propeller protein